MALRAFADYHTHTIYSHGLGTVRQNAQAAHRQGLTQVGIADHGPATAWGLGVDSLETFREIRREVDECSRTYDDLEVLLGCEANIIDYEGHLDVPMRVQKELDIVLAGFHRLIRPRSLVEGFDFLVSEALAGRSEAVRRRARTQNTKAVVEALYRNDIDILTHPGLNIDIDTFELARAAQKTDTCLEINCHHAEDLLEFVKIASRGGARFSIDTDAHSPDNVGRLDDGVRVAEQAGLGPEQLLNVCDSGQIPSSPW